MIVIVELKPIQAMPLDTMMPDAHPKSLRLLWQMLRWTPSQRISAESALKDPYLNEYHNPSDEPVCTSPLDSKFDEDKVMAGSQFVTIELMTVQCLVMAGSQSVTIEFMTLRYLVLLCCV